MPNYMNPVDLKRYVSSIQSYLFKSPQWEQITPQVVTVNLSPKGMVLDGTLLLNPETRYTQYFYYSHTDKDYVFENAPTRKSLKNKGARS